MNTLQNIFRRPTLMIPVLICLIGTATAGISIATLFKVSMDEEKSRLTQMVRSQARLMESIAKFDALDNVQDHPDGAFGATMEQIVSAHKSLNGFGETGEFVIGRLIEGRVAVLQKPRYESDINFQIPEFVPIPMQKALMGESGEIIATDYKGHQVLASYEPVSVLNIGLVAKIDIAELHRPFIISGVIAAVLSAFMLVIGIFAARFFAAPFEEKEAALKKLSKSQLELAKAQELAGLGSWTWNITDNSEEWSDEQFRIFGYEPGEVEPTLELFVNALHPQDRQNVIAEVENTLKNDDPYDTEFRIIDTKGNVRHIRALGEVTRDGNGEAVSMIGTVMDITDRKKIENELRYNEQRFRDITESSSDWFWETDSAHSFTYVSEKGPETIGCKRDDIIGKSRWDMYENYKGDHYWELHRDDMENHRMFRDYEYAIDIKGGGELIVSVNGTPVIDDVGKFLGYRGTARNVTTRRVAEQSLKKSEERFNKSQNFANIGTWDWNIQTGELYWSDRIGSLFGYEPGKLETTYDNFVAAIHPDDRKKVTEAVNACVEHGVEYNIEHRVVWPDGTVRYLLEKGDVVRNEDGLPLNMLGVVQDITEAKNMQAQLIQSSKMATLGEMATGVAHELNQPLNIIRMALSNIQRKSKYNKADPEYLSGKLEKIDSQVERASAIIDHMRIFGRKSDVTPEQLDPKKVVESTLGLIGEQLRLANIEVISEAPVDCHCIVGHQVQIEQVLLNLIGNARDSLQSKEDGDKRLSITVGENEFSVFIAVEDTGGGIAEDDLPRVFEPFYTTKEVGKGTGLGLSISYGIINDIGGTITASNTEDGARFVISLPQCKEDTSQIS
ncbi:MAG: PAS domain-containing protein [Rhodospirillales bacterium]|nr:PAS domain-containing protein [Rhodospirillales bacterium]